MNKLVAALEEMIEAIDDGQIHSPMITGGGDPDIGYETWSWHQEWVHYAKQALSEHRAEPPHYKENLSEWDVEHLIMWIDGGCKEPAQTAFTAGGKRQVARAIEKYRAEPSADVVALLLINRKRERCGMKPVTKEYMVRLDPNSWDEYYEDAKAIAAMQGEG